MSTFTTHLTLTNSNALKQEWRELHDKKRNEELHSQTARELLAYARTLGLRKTHIEKYGPSQAKKSIISAIHDIFLLNKIVAAPSGSGDSDTTRKGSYSSDDEFDDDDAVSLRVLQREKALKHGEAKLEGDMKDMNQLNEFMQSESEKLSQEKTAFGEASAKRERAQAKRETAFEKQKKTFEAGQKSVKVRFFTASKKDKADFDKKLAEVKKDKANLEKQLAEAKQQQGVSIQERANFYREKTEHAGLREKLRRSQIKLEQQKKTFASEKASFDAGKVQQQALLQKMQIEVKHFRSESLKRKRSAIHLETASKRATTEKNRAIVDIERVLSQLKGEKYWSFSCPSQLRGTDAALWSKFKCKRLVNGQEYSSDVLRGPKGQVPKWANLTEVVNVLCSQVV